MSELELGFAWHHSKQPKHARTDFEDMLENNCTAVLIAASEDDFNYWYPNLVEIIGIAKDVGLKVIVNFWAFGGVFGGEPSSFFLHQNHRFRQVTAASKEAVPAACINQDEFRNYFHDKVRTLMRDASPDGVFLDEPHYYPLFDESEFTCVCEACQEKFSAVNGFEMPMDFVDSVKSFRERSLHEFLVDTCRVVKSERQETEVTVCIIPHDLIGLGVSDWDRIASIAEVDVFSTDPYYCAFGRSREWAIATAERTIATAKRYGKKSQLWLQMFRLPKGEEQNTASLVSDYASLGVDSIFGWSYLANKGTTISSDQPDILSRLVTDEYRKMG